MQETVKVTEALAAFIHDLTPENVPEAVTAKARKATVDAFAAILCGAASEVAPPLLRYLARAATTGNAIVLGTGVKTSAEMAALANGALGAALEYDDVFSAMPGHPAAIIVPALCAEAAREPIDGMRFLDAFAIGYEVGAKVALGIGMGHYQRRGFHATGTLAMFSALAAVARLRRLPVEQIRMAFGAGASMAAGLQCQFGTMMKPFHSGWAARCALAAVDLAQCGYSASMTAFEQNDGGFFAAYGTTESEPARALTTLGNPWSLVEPGYALKKFPSCYAGHRAIDGILTLRRQLDLSAATVDQVVCRVAPGALNPMKYPSPNTGLEAKFSVPYALAVGVLDGRYTLWSFTDEAVRRPAVRALLPRMLAVEDERCLGGDPEQLKRSWGSRGYVEVEARTIAGRSAAVRVDLAPGHPQRELTWDEVREKFADCAGYAGLPAPAAAETYARLRDLDACKDLGPVLEAMRKPTRTPTAVTPAGS